MIIEVVDDPPDGTNWPERGARFVVLAIHMSDGRGPSYRVVHDREGIPVLLSDGVEVVDGSLPDHWTFFHHAERGYSDIGPQRWHRVGFWEDFFDDEPEALRDYEEQLALTLGSLP